jgi:hypothetical protein
MMHVQQYPEDAEEIRAVLGFLPETAEKCEIEIDCQKVEYLDKHAGIFGKYSLPTQYLHVYVAASKSALSSSNDPLFKFSVIPQIPGDRNPLIEDFGDPSSFAFRTEVPYEDVIDVMSVVSGAVQLRKNTMVGRCIATIKPAIIKLLG